MFMTSNLQTYHIFYPGRDWEGDFQMENGNYECLCIACKRPFIGHKRRLLCFECYNIQK